MKLSTRILHARIRLKHNFLKLRIQKPLYYKALATLVLIFAIGGLLAAYHFYLERDESTALGDQTQLEIKSYSLNGEVTAVNGNVIEIKTPTIRTLNGVNTVEYIPKRIRTNSSTEVARIKFVNNKASSSLGLLIDVTPGKLVAAYTTEDPADSIEPIATKIEMLE